MASPEDQKGAPPPLGEGPPSPADPRQLDGSAGETHVSYAPVTDASIANDAPHTYADANASVETAPSTAVVKANPSSGRSGGGTPPPPPPDSDDGEEDGMLRMSFLEHLEELRTRILRALAGVAVAFAFSL